MTKQELYTQYGPKLRTPLPGPKARAAVEADGRLISPSYTRSYPLVAKRGRGVRLEDVDGNEFLDFAAGIAVVSTGHCHPEVVGAIQKQAYLELIDINGFKNITIQKEKTITIPDDILGQYLNPEEITAFRQSGTGIVSVTVFAEKPKDGAPCCTPGCCS